MSVPNFVAFGRIFFALSQVEYKNPGFVPPLKMGVLGACTKNYLSYSYSFMPQSCSTWGPLMPQNLGTSAQPVSVLRQVPTSNVRDGTPQISVVFWPLTAPPTFILTHTLLKTVLKCLCNVYPYLWAICQCLNAFTPPHQPLSRYPIGPNPCGVPSRTLLEAGKLFAPSAAKTCPYIRVFR